VAKNDSFTNLYTLTNNNTPTLKNSIIQPTNKFPENFPRREKNIFKYPIPKMKKDIIPNLNLSGSIKNIEELKDLNTSIKGKKIKTLSLSPKGGKHYNNSFSNNKDLNKDILDKKSNNNSPVSLKILKNDYLLPKVLMTETKDSDRNKTSSSNTRKSCYSKEETYNFIFNTFYNKLIEAQNSIRTNDTLAIIDCFIKIFDYLALNADIKFKNINDIIKVYCDPKLTVKNYKAEIDSLIEQNAKISFELELLKDKFNKKEMLAQSYLDKMKEQELYMTKLKSKIQSLRELKEENKQLKDFVKNSRCEVEFLREKEGKLMKVIYNLHKKGIAIDELLNENQPQEEISSDISTQTYYFPDKVNMKTQSKENIPRLDLGRIMDYESQEQQNFGKNGTIYFNDINYIVEPSDQNKKLNFNKKFKPQDFNVEFFQKHNEWSESWRNDAKEMKSFQEYLKKKK
jgi:hypothetical protein